MNNTLVYPHERTLGVLTLILGSLVWLGLFAGTFGIALLGLATGFVIYLFAQSTLIAHIKGNGVELSETQFPELYAQFTACCERLQLKKQPQAYILNGNGGLNAFATKFLGAQYVVLMSDVVDAMSKHPDGVRFYLGHELGHLRMKHLHIGHLLRWPVLWVPLLGAAYSRAKESTCDRHGLACASSPENAARALAALSAGAERWKELDVASYLKQTQAASGFWMSFHELTAGYPWITKRVTRVMDAPVPERNGVAYLPALFVPYGGRLGAGLSFLIMIYILAVLAAIGLPAYQDYITRAKLSVAIVESQSVRDAIGNYYIANNQGPKSLEALGISGQLPSGAKLMFDPDSLELDVVIKQGALAFMPSLGDNNTVVWDCMNGGTLKPIQVPPNCRRLSKDDQ